MNRKNFAKTAGLAAAAFAMPTGNLFAYKKPEAKVKLAIIGVGARGLGHLDLNLRRNDVDVVAICDVDAKTLGQAKSMIQKSGKKMPQVFTGDDMAWKKMLEMKNGLDGVLIATPWEWHKPMIIGALESGIKYVVTEVMSGITLHDHWDVLKAAENMMRR